MRLSNDQINHHIAERDRLGPANYAFTAANASDAALLFTALGASLYRRQPKNDRKRVTVRCAIDCQFIADDMTAITLHVERYVQAMRTAITRLRKSWAKRRIQARAFSFHYERWDRFTSKPSLVIITMHYSEDDATNDFSQAQSGVLDKIMSLI